MTSFVLKTEIDCRSIIIRNEMERAMNTEMERTMNTTNEQPPTTSPGKKAPGKKAPRKSDGLYPGHPYRRLADDINGICR